MKTTLRLTIAAFGLGAFNLSAATDPLVSWEPLNPLPTANRCGPESDGYADGYWRERLTTEQAGQPVLSARRKSGLGSGSVALARPLVGGQGKPTRSDRPLHGHPVGVVLPAL